MTGKDTPLTDELLRQMAAQLATRPDPETIYLALKIAFLNGGIVALRAVQVQEDA